MSKFTKTITGVVSALALVAVATTASAATFSTNLKQGSSGAAVSDLQAFLVSNGYLVMPPGVNMGYFGSLTKAAVIAFQTAKSITPAVGYFGPITQAAANAMGSSVSTVPGCVAGAMYSSSTGAPCTTTTTVAGCPAGAMYNYMTGALCTTTTTSPSGQEGSFTTRLASLPSDNANIRSTSDVPIYGIEVKAVGSDVSIDRVDLQFAVTPSGGSAQNPGSFITALTFKDGSTVLKTVALSSADFSKDSNDRYHVLVSGIGFKVVKDAIKVLTATMNTVSISSTDSNRAVTVQGYAGNANNVRGVDGAGIQSYADMSGSANTRSHTAKAPGNATLTVTIDDSLTPDASNSKVSSTNGIIKMTMLAFSAKAETGDAKLTKLYVANNATATAGLATTLYLTDLAGNVLSSVSGGSTLNAEVLLNNINVNIPKDTTSKFLIKADYPTTALVQMASTSLAVNSVQWEKPDGSTASTTPSSAIASNDQYMDTAVPVWTLISAPTPTVTAPAYVSAASSTITATLTFKVVANGGALTKPVIGDFGLVFASSTQTTYTTGSGGAGCNVDGSAWGAGTCGFTSVIDSISPSDATVGDGGSYLVTVKATMQSATSIGWDVVKQSANYFLAATSTKGTVGSNAVRQTWNTTDWKTPSAYLTHT